MKGMNQGPRKVILGYVQERENGSEISLQFLVWMTGGTVMSLNENENKKALGHWELSVDSFH